MELLFFALNLLAHKLLSLSVKRLSIAVVKFMGIQHGCDN